MIDRNGTPQSQAALVQWIRFKYPRYYAQAIAQSGVGLGDFASAVSKIFDSVKSAVSTLGPVYIQTKAELELLKLNIARAKAGQNPVNSLADANDTGSGSGGGGGLSMGGLPTWAIPVGIGALVLLFLMRR